MSDSGTLGESQLLRWLDKTFLGGQDYLATLRLAAHPLELASSGARRHPSSAAGASPSSAGSASPSSAAADVHRAQRVLSTDTSPSSAGGTSPSVPQRTSIERSESCRPTRVRRVPEARVHRVPQARVHRAQRVLAGGTSPSSKASPVGRHESVERRRRESIERSESCGAARSESCRAKRVLSGAVRRASVERSESCRAARVIQAP
jgi:hypothetical protein